MKTSLLTFTTLAALNAMCSAAAIGIAIDSGSRSLRDEGGVVLSGGAPAVARDGTQVILGYFADATTAAPFGSVGSDAFSSFVALTGPGTPAWGAGNTVNNFTVGDDPVNITGSGELFKDTFAINTGVQDTLLPAADTPLILRFFNRNSAAASSFVLDLANVNGLWNWKLPATPASSLNINLSDPGLVQRAIGLNNRGVVPVAPATVNLGTNNPVIPEPTSVLLALSGAAVIFGRRRR